MARFYGPDTTRIFGETDRAGAALEELLSNTNNNRRGSSNYWLGDLLNALFPWGTSARELQARRGPRQSRFPATRRPLHNPVDPAAVLAKPPAHLRPFVPTAGAPNTIPAPMASAVSGLAPGGSTPIRYRYDANGGRVDLYGRPVNNFGNIVAPGSYETYVPTNRNTQAFRPRPGGTLWSQTHPNG